ncbi:MAG: hypothetical protein HKUEN02_21860 [Anaerolineaceae bacterium]|nr:MAG: hypothetical protein HKUEN02_21860 [Anaerolineaceae bacterium]
MTPTPTQSPSSTPTSTVTPEPALPTYGEIDPTVADKLKAEGITIPEELNNPEYGLKMATEFFQTHWCTAFGDLLIPISTVPENGIAYGPYGIKGIGMTEEACTAYAEQHIKYMWIHYREYGNPADREITLEQYVELLRAGRGGFEIPQYNPETGFFDKKAMVNPLAGDTKIISDNKFKELPLKVSDKDSYLFYVDKNGMVWAAGNDLEFNIEGWLDSPNIDTKIKLLTNDLSLANSLLVSGYTRIGLSTNFCLSTGNSVGSCVQDGFKLEDKYTDKSDWLVEAYKVWLAQYKAGDLNAQRPVWVEYR